MGGERTTQALEAAEHAVATVSKLAPHRPAAPAGAAAAAWRPWAVSQGEETASAATGAEAGPTLGPAPCSRIASAGRLAAAPFVNTLAKSVKGGLDNDVIKSLP